MKLKAAYLWRVGTLEGRQWELQTQISILPDMEVIRALLTGQVESVQKVLFTYTGIQTGMCSQQFLSQVNGKIWNRQMGFESLLGCVTSGILHKHSKD